MAAVEVTITGMLYDKLARTTQNVVLIGEASLTGLGVGGGPIIPPQQPPSGGGPPGTPTFPIWGPPGIELPPGPGYPPIAGHPLPEPPTPELPPDLPTPVPPSTVIKEPPAEGGWGLYSDSNGAIYWGFTPGGGAGPK